MKQRRTTRLALWPDLWPLLALMLAAALSIGMLQWSYQQLSGALQEQTTALDNMTQARLNISRSYLTAEQARAGSPIALPQDAVAYADRALLAVDDWLGGRSTRSRMQGRPPADADLRSLLLAYRTALGNYRALQLDVGSAAQTGPVDARVAYAGLERQANALEQRMYERLEATTRLQSRWHGIALLVWSGFMVALGGTVLQVTRVRRAAVRALEASEQRFRVQADASRAFAAAQLAIEPVLDSVVEQVATSIGDGCALSLLALDDNAPLASTIAHRNPAAAQLLRELLADTPPKVGEGLMGRVAQTGEAVFLPTIVQDEYAVVGRTVLLPYVRRYGVHSLLAVPLRGRDRMVGVLVLLRDETQASYNRQDLQLAQEIADRAALAIDNVRLYQAAQDALRMREIFLSIAAHELRTPLTSIMGHAFRLTRRAERSETIGVSERKSLAAMQVHGKRLNALIEELLDVSRLELGQFAIRRQELDIVALVERVLGELAATREHEHITARLPAAPVLINGDAQHLEQVLDNLLGNAVKYSPHGGPITVELDTTATSVLLAVTDSGIGIPPRDLPKVFGQFFRASNIDPREIRGLGIGLYITRAIVEQHGGSISVASTVGVGSRFAITLPLLRCDDASEPEAPAGA